MNVSDGDCDQQNDVGKVDKEEWNDRWEMIMQKAAVENFEHRARRRDAYDKYHILRTELLVLVASVGFG